jgi:hypothetical protein
MKPKLEKVSAELRSVRPRLICLVEPEGGLRFNVTPYISQGEYDREEVVSEGYDPDHSPLGCPVYWRIVNRGDEQFYCSTFLATRDQVERAWGTVGLTYCDSATGNALARIETKLRNISCEGEAVLAVSFGGGTQSLKGEINRSQLTGVANVESSLGR